MTAYRTFKRSERELRFPLAVSVSYHNGDPGKLGEVVPGYVACDLQAHTYKGLVSRSAQPALLDRVKLHHNAQQDFSIP